MRNKAAEWILAGEKNDKNKNLEGRKNTRKEIYSEIAGRKSFCFKTEPVLGSYELNGERKKPPSNLIA